MGAQPSQVDGALPHQSAPGCSCCRPRHICTVGRSAQSWGEAGLASPLKMASKKLLSLGSTAPPALLIRWPWVAGAPSPQGSSPGALFLAAPVLGTDKVAMECKGRGLAPALPSMGDGATLASLGFPLG